MPRRTRSKETASKPPPPPPPPRKKRAGRTRPQERVEKRPFSQAPPPPQPQYDDYHTDYDYEKGVPPDQYYKDGYNGESRRLEEKAEVEKRPPINFGTALALIGFAVLIIGILLPLYHLSFAADIETRTPKIDYRGNITGNETIMEYSTNGTQTLFLIEGKSGIHVNMPTEKGGVESVFRSEFPYGYLYIVLLIITITLGFTAKSPTKRGRRYIVAGILALIPIFIILILVSQLGGIIGEDKMEPPLDSFIKMLSAGPIGGALPLEIDYEYDTEVTPPDPPQGFESETATVTTSVKFHTSITWGLGLGGFLIILGCILTIAGGAIDIYLARMHAMRISAYRSAMQRAYEDLHLSPDEANIILGLKDNLEITEKQHREIRKELLGK